MDETKNTDFTHHRRASTHGMHNSLGHNRGKGKKAKSGGAAIYDLRPLMVAKGRGK